MRNSALKKRRNGIYGWKLKSAVTAMALVAGLSVGPAQAQDGGGIPQVPYGACGPMDVVFVIDTTGSMGGAIDNIVNDLETIVTTIQNAAGDDERLGLVVVNGYSERTYDSAQVYDCAIPDANLDPNQYLAGMIGDCIVVLRELGSSTVDVTNSISLLTASNGGENPEITAEALRTVLLGWDQTSDVTGGPTPNATPPGAISGDPDKWPRLQWNNWNTGFRGGETKKIIFLVTDNVPGGTDSRFNQILTEDSDLAAAMATQAAGDGVVIQPVLVALSDESYEPTAETIMGNYASATGGTLLKVPFNGAGTAVGIVSIIENCGEDLEPKEGRMTGGGSIFNAEAAKKDRVTHGFTLHCDGGPNNLQVNWTKNVFHMESLTEANCYDYPELDEQNPVAGFDTMIGSGVGRLNGVPGAIVEFTFVDDGEPGKVSDTARIKITDGSGTVLEVTGTLENGNHQAHPEN